MLHEVWKSRKFWFSVGGWFIVTVMMFLFLQEASDLLVDKHITAAIWQSVTTGMFTTYLMFTGAVLGIYSTANLASKGLNWQIEKKGDE